MNEHKFRHNFNDTINPMCNCGAATETTIHYLLRCWVYSIQRVELLDGVYKLDSTLQNSSEDQLLTVPFYGSEKYSLNVNKEILRLTISYLKASERFVQQHLYLFIFFKFFFFNVWLYRACCKRLYLTWALCLIPSTVLGILFHICCFIVSFTACKDPWYKKKEKKEHFQIR